MRDLPSLTDDLKIPSKPVHGRPAKTRAKIERECLVGNNVDMRGISKSRGIGECWCEGVEVPTRLKDAPNFVHYLDEGISPVRDVQDAWNVLKKIECRDEIKFVVPEGYWLDHEIRFNDVVAKVVTHIDPISLVCIKMVSGVIATTEI